MIEGLVSIGGRMEPETLKSAYAKGIFPWPQDDLPLLWFSPDPRGVLDFSEIHVPRSLQKKMRQVEGHWSWTVNTAFERVMRECQKQARPNQEGTWILPNMIPAYLQLFRQGHALSVECWQEDELIGGIYGVLSQNYFSGESMFHKRSDASKTALLFMVEHLKTLGLTWMDIQMVTSVTESMGGKYISRDDFCRRIGVPSPMPIPL